MSLMEFLVIITVCKYVTIYMYLHISFKFEVLWIEPRVSYMLGKYSTTGVQPQPPHTVLSRGKLIA